MSSERKEQRKAELLAKKKKIKHQMLAVKSLGYFGSYVKSNLIKSTFYNAITSEIMDFLKSPESTMVLGAPPQHGKSLAVSRLLPAFFMALFPTKGVLAYSYSASLAWEMCYDVKMIMNSKEYKELFPHIKLTREIKSGFNISYYDKHKKEWVEGAKYRCAGVNGSMTGFTGDGLNIIDDPFKNLAAAESQAIMKSTLSWYDSVFNTRQHDGAKVIIMSTRWRVDDLAGYVIKQKEVDPENYNHKIVNFPALMDRGIKNLSKYDSREEGEALFENLHKAKKLELIKRDSIDLFMSMYQQVPVASSGKIFNKAVIEKNFYFKWQLPPADRYYISIDLAFKDNEDNDFSVLQVWQLSGNSLYLLEQIREKIEYNEQLESAKALYFKYRGATLLVEDKANGSALISDLKKIVWNVIPIVPKESKKQRAKRAARYMKINNVHIPSPVDEKWILNDYLPEILSFDKSRHDDQVDATGQVITYVFENEVSSAEQARFDEAYMATIGKFGHNQFNKKVVA